MNRQGNTYTILYSIALVLLVGVALSIVYQALRPKQEENIANDTRRQILASSRIIPSGNEDVAALWKQHITDSFIVDADGKKCDSNVNPDDINVAAESKLPPAERRLPVYVCLTDDGQKYILPVYGAGLWGPIWGYVSFDSNGQTIYGAYFAHQGETPGLGAEIEKPKFQDQFEGKQIFSSSGQFTGVAVSKAGQAPEGKASVNAISGGTITSQGVERMLDNCLKPYSAFLQHLATDHNDTQQSQS